jgi:hypothetical protein
MRWTQVDIKTKSDGSARWAARFKCERPVDTTRASLLAFSDSLRDAEAWCRDHFGKGHASHPDKYRWHMDRFAAHFRYPDDAFAFKMRWS